MGARTFTDDDLRTAVGACTSVTAVLRELGLRPAGGNHASIRRHIARLALDTSHFRHGPPPRRASVPLDAVLVRGAPYKSARLKERLYAAGLKERRCELCGQGEQWQGRRMSLILDHVNGEHDDNRLENLRIVCPNCNATLDTHCGRRSRRRTERPCELCGRQFLQQRSTQRFCSRACSARRPRRHTDGDGRRLSRPPEAQLRAEVAAEGYVATGRRHGVSDTAIRKWLRAYERERQAAAAGPAPDADAAGARGGAPPPP